MAEKTSLAKMPTKAETPVVELKEQDLDETQGACPSRSTGFEPKAKGLIQTLGR